MAVPFIELEDLVVSLYCALDDALREAGICLKNGKLVPRRGGAPEMDDREVLCLAVLQEMLGFESDNKFHRWFNANPMIQKLFPRRLNRQNFADRRALLTPLMERLCEAFCKMSEGSPPFSSSTRIQSMSAAPSAWASTNVLRAWPNWAVAPR